MTHPFSIRDLLSIFCLLLGLGASAQRMSYQSSAWEVLPAGGQGKPAYRLVIHTLGASDPLLLTGLRFAAPVQKGDSITLIADPDSLLPAQTFVSKGKGREWKGEQLLSPGANYFRLSTPGGVLPELLSFELSRQDYQTVWADEFEGPGIDTANWSFEQGFARNEEDQWYQEENASVSRGSLTIEARREDRPNPLYQAGSRDWRRRRERLRYTSSSLHTRGKRSWTYGRFDLRARIDTVSGYWPAWWTLGQERGWPANGEIDIMEYYTGKVLANIAVAGTDRRALWWSKTYPVHKFDGDWKNRFHHWRMDWDKEGIRLYLDDTLLNAQPMSQLYNRDGSGFFPFQQPHYMLINLAIGGQNGGDPAPSAFPLKYEVDYVRVAQKVPGRFRCEGRYRPVKNGSAVPKFAGQKSSL